MRRTDLQIGRLYPVTVPDDYDEAKAIGVKRAPPAPIAPQPNLGRRSTDSSTAPRAELHAAAAVRGAFSS